MKRSTAFNPVSVPHRRCYPRLLLRGGPNDQIRAQSEQRTATKSTENETDHRDSRASDHSSQCQQQRAAHRDSQKEKMSSILPLHMPFKVILLNILSLSATFGGLVWIFQDGHLQNLLNFPTASGIDSSMPVLIFTIAFGLSMDYEVFLLSRIKEHFDRTGDNRKAVSTGLQQTGWLITSAAVLFTVVVGAFGTSKIISIQEIGVGLAIAVLIDATLVRMLLVPAAMRLLGELNWWAPAPLHRLWQRIGFTEAANESIETREGTQSVLAEHSAKIEA